jgi:hypothetical protein
MHRRQEWMGHARISTTEIYADFMPADNEAELVDSAFAGAQPTGQTATLIPGTNQGPN